jgi:hypothetical protein
MKTFLSNLALALILSLNVSVAQKINPAECPNRLPDGLELDNSIIRKYLITTDYMDYDLKANFLRKTRVTGEYTCGLDGDSVQWNNVSISQTNDLSGPFPGGQNKGYMDNFRYLETENLLKEEFLNKIPETDFLIRNLIWDAFGFKVLAYSSWDSLKLNTEYRANDLNSELTLGNNGTFENKDIRLTWNGITKINNEICAIIKYSVMNNPLKLELENLTLSGRSHYWGEVFVSLTDKQIEHAILSEDVITDVLFKGQASNILGYTVRDITLSRIQ